MVAISQIKFRTAFACALLVAPSTAIAARASDGSLSPSSSERGPQSAAAAAAAAAAVLPAPVPGDRRRRRVGAHSSAGSSAYGALQCQQDAGALLTSSRDIEPERLALRGIPMYKPKPPRKSLTYEQMTGWMAMIKDRFPYFRRRDRAEWEADMIRIFYDAMKHYNAAPMAHAENGGLNYRDWLADYLHQEVSVDPAHRVYKSRAE